MLARTARSWVWGGAFCGSFCLGISSSIADEEKDQALAPRSSFEEYLARDVGSLLAGDIVTYRSVLQARSSVIEFLEHKNLILRPAEEKRQALRLSLGDERYDAVKARLKDQFSSGRKDSFIAGITGLGFVIFDTESATSFKHLVFTKDADIQKAAIKSLAALGVEGCQELALQLALAARPRDVVSAADVGDAFKAISLSGDEEFVKSTIVRIVEEKSSPYRAMWLRPFFYFMETSSDSEDLALRMFLSDEFRPRDATGLEFEEDTKTRVERMLIRVLTIRGPRHMQNPAVRQKIESYLFTQNHQELFIYSLLALERFGESVEFFRKLESDERVATRFRPSLDNVLARLSSGNRSAYRASIRE